MNADTANTRFNFELPHLSYIDAKWEEPTLRAAAETARPARKAGLGAWIARQIAAYRTWQRNQQAIRELGMMTDHELGDIGISRSDFGRMFDPALNEDLRRRGQIS